MKKLFLNLILINIIFLAALILILSTKGIQTNKFNEIIAKKIKHTNNNIKLDLETIKFKIDISELSLFLETFNPKINYRDTALPAKNIKVYIDFLSLAKSSPNIKKINIALEELKINQLKELSSNLKPSNFKSILNNKILDGNLNSELEIYFNEDNLFENFIARGKVSNLDLKISKDIKLVKTKFNFFADRSDILLQNINTNLDFIQIKNGDLKLSISDKIILESNFKTNIAYKGEKDFEILNIIKKYTLLNDIQDLEAEISNNIKLILDKTYKVKSFRYSNNGKVKKSFLNFKKPINDIISNEEINNLSLINSDLKSTFDTSNNKISISGKYSLNKGEEHKFDLTNNNVKNLNNLLINFQYKNKIKIDIINYEKPKGKLADFKIDLEKINNSLNFKNIKFSERNNFMEINNLRFKNNQFQSLKNISIKTQNNKKKNNDFKIQFKDKILIKGSKFDATNLPKILNQKSETKILNKINKDIEIDFSNIIAPLSENIESFKLLGRIERGKFTKISSKGSFGGENFLDITMKDNKKNNKKYLEIYSDLTRPLLTEYNFFKGLTGGNLLFSSVIEENRSTSKLMIENFKVINAPGMVKLLSLADLGGLADLAEGEGLSFDILEIKMEKSDNNLKLNEILALGPSISVLMEGYQDPNVTSLRGTLVPAKTLNKMISKIPVIGDIVIPKEVGEGLFGISFKMKGPPGKIKTTINPIRTITPRFIQKIMDRKKRTK